MPPTVQTTWFDIGESPAARPAKRAKGPKAPKASATPPAAPPAKEEQQEPRDRQRSRGRAKSRNDGKLTAAEMMAAEQREISVSDFFTKNRHLLGYDNPKKALLTVVREAVDNSLDACEEADILPEITVLVNTVPGKEDRFHVLVEDNGPGIVHSKIPNIFARLLYGSKFHRLRQSRGQQGIGISAAVMYAQMTTGKPARIVSRISPRHPARLVELRLDTAKNKPEILLDQPTEWDCPHGTRIELTFDAKFQRGRQSVEDYLQQTAIANPHMRLTYKAPDQTEPVVFERATRELPEKPRAIKPHPYGVELGTLLKMMRSSSSHKLGAFLQGDFARVSAKVASEICAKAGLASSSPLKRIAATEAERVHTAIQQTKIIAPPTDCLSPIGEELLIAGLKKEVEADLYVAKTRAPTVYRGNPFLVEAAIAFGGKLPADELVRVCRYANRVPLLYQQSACAIAKAVITTDWRNYRVSQARGALPTAPMIIAVHVASAWVPFTSESKEAIAHYPEIVREVRLALQDCGRKISLHISRRRREADALKKRQYIEKYLPHIGDALRDILGLTEKERANAINVLEDILERSRKL
ncbi:MAG: DNA topoisomerase VI subunit B [Planctomycetota bacterium]